MPTTCAHRPSAAGHVGEQGLEHPVGLDAERSSGGEAVAALRRVVLELVHRERDAGASAVRRRQGSWQAMVPTPTSPDPTRPTGIDRDRPGSTRVDGLDGGDGDARLRPWSSMIRTLRRPARRAGPRQPYRLDDRYRRDDGTVFLSGAQALARLPFEQLRIDRAAGLRTAAYVDRLPGQSARRVRPRRRHGRRRSPPPTGSHLVHQPAVNEELAATAVMGSQLSRHPRLVSLRRRARHLVRQDPRPRPGERRPAPRTVRRHVAPWRRGRPRRRRSDCQEHDVALVQRRHAGRSPHADDVPRRRAGGHRPRPSCRRPVACVGVWARSRWSKPWPTAPARSSCIPIGSCPWCRRRGRRPRRSGAVQPDAHRALLTPYTLDVEREFHEVRLEVARSYGVLNRLNTVTVRGPHDWIGWSPAAHTFGEVREALRLLGLRTDDDLRVGGRPPAPVAHAGAARHRRRTRVRRRSRRGGRRRGQDAEPRVAGDGRAVRPLADVRWWWASARPTSRRCSRRPASLTPTPSLPVCALGWPPRWPTASRSAPPRRSRSAAHPAVGEPHAVLLLGLPAQHVHAGARRRARRRRHRLPHDGDADGAGAVRQHRRHHGDGQRGRPVVRHGAVRRRARTCSRTSATAPSSTRGMLAIRAAVANGVNITYKMLYNGAVVDDRRAGPRRDSSTCRRSCKVLLAEGVRRVIVTTDDLGRYRGVDLPLGVDGVGRDRLARGAGGAGARCRACTVLIHDQRCAAELRRDRKRGRVAASGVAAGDQRAGVRGLRRLRPGRATASPCSRSTPRSDARRAIDQAIVQPRLRRASRATARRS